MAVMTTELLAQTDAYLREFDAVVLEADTAEGAVALDRTAFYPGGGGQPPDQGLLAGLPVVRLKRQAELIWHWLGSGGAGGTGAGGAAGAGQVPALPAVGASVHGVLDWERRYALMRTHTAFHILCGVVWRDYRAQVTGGNMEPLKGRMDFEFETLHGDLVHEIEAKLAAEVAAARAVRVRLLPREEAFQIPDLIRTKINLLPEDIRIVRTVEIEGLDLQADGGTHVANTREVGVLRVAGYKSKGRINKRIELVLE
jgi:misacylated tRNA(Ala) deacylase